MKSLGYHKINLGRCICKQGRND